MPANGVRSLYVLRHTGRPCARSDYRCGDEDDLTPDGPNQLWVADMTYVAIATGFVYLAAILDAWSRRVVGYAISRSIDARLAVAALKAAVSARDPPRGCVHHSDRGSQYASEDYRMVLREHGLRGSMGRRGNPYDNAKAESFMKTLKVEAVYLMAYEIFEDVGHCRPTARCPLCANSRHWSMSRRCALYIQKQTSLPKRKGTGTMAGPPNRPH